MTRKPFDEALETRHGRAGRPLGTLEGAGGGLTEAQGLLLRPLALRLNQVEGFGIQGHVDDLLIAMLKSEGVPQCHRSRILRHPLRHQSLRSLLPHLLRLIQVHLKQLDELVLRLLIHREGD